MKVTSSDYDNVCPEINKTVTAESDYLTFTASDSMSGIKRIKATVWETQKVYESDTDSILVPCFDNFSNTINVEAEDAAGNIRHYETTICSFLKTFERVYKSGGEWVLETKELQNLYSNMHRTEMYALGMDAKWNHYKTIPSNKSIKIIHMETGGKIGQRILNSSDLPENASFIKAVSKENTYDYFYQPLYFYTGEPSTDIYDYIQDHTKKSVLVASDAPVFVHTLATEKSYSECKDWTSAEWEFYHKDVGNAYMEFSSEDRTPQKYNIPVEEIDDGWCYCVIAHFANGNTSISDIMVK